MGPEASPVPVSPVVSEPLPLPGRRASSQRNQGLRRLLIPLPTPPPVQFLSDSRRAAFPVELALRPSGRGVCRPFLPLVSCEARGLRVLSSVPAPSAEQLSDC